MKRSFIPAPPLQVSRWFNSALPLSLEALKGQVVAIHAFQMLCPGCVAHGIPQAVRIHETFDARDVRVIGLHTVFEHHRVMNEDALAAFIHEYKLAFPIGVDRAAADAELPLTMQALALRGTPSLIVIDKLGRIRLNHFGRLDDLTVGYVLGTLIEEPLTEHPEPSAELPEHAQEDRNAAAGGCSDVACAADGLPGNRPAQ